MKYGCDNMKKVLEKDEDGIPIFIYKKYKCLKNSPSSIFFSFKPYIFYILNPRRKTINQYMIDEEYHWRKVEKNGKVLLEATICSSDGTWYYPTIEFKNKKERGKFLRYKNAIGFKVMWGL